MLKFVNIVIMILNKYSNFEDFFSFNLANVFLKYIKIKYLAIKFIDDWQSSYNCIYNPKLIKIEKLNTYIKGNLANDFIKL